MSINESPDKPCKNCVKKDSNCRPTYWNSNYWCVHYTYLENPEDKKILEFLAYAKNNGNPDLDRLYLEWKKSLKKN